MVEKEKNISEIGLKREKDKGGETENGYRKWEREREREREREKRAERKK